MDLTEEQAKKYLDGTKDENSIKKLFPKLNANLDQGILMSILKVVPLAGKMVQKFSYMSQVVNYQISLGQYYGTRSALTYLKSLKVKEGHVVNELVNIYMVKIGEKRREIELLRIKYPNLVRTLENQIANLSLLHTEMHEYEHMQEKEL